MLAACSKTSPPLATAPGTDAGSSAEAPPVVPMRADNEHVRRIGEQALLITADPELDLEMQAFVDLLWQMYNDGARLYDGQKLAVGWTTLSFRSQRGPEGGQFFVVSAPDYSDEAGEKSSDDLSATLRVLQAQREWLLRVEVLPEPINFDQHVLVVRGAIDTEQVFLVRVESPGGRLTGWRLAPVDVQAGNMGEVDSVPVHELWRRRPALLQTLLLPAGYMSYFSGDEVVAIVDGADQVVWQAERGSDE